MGVLDSLSQTSHSAVDAGEKYIEKTQEYYKLKVFQQLTTTIGLFCRIAIIGILLLLGVTLIIIAATLALGILIGSMVYACLMVASLLLILFKTATMLPVADKLTSWCKLLATAWVEFSKSTTKTNQSLGIGTNSLGSSNRSITDILIVLRLE